MILYSRVGGFSVALLVLSGSLLAGTQEIGRASSQNGLIIDNARATSSGRVFDGSTIQAAAQSRIRLTNGTHVDLSAGSQAQVFAGHLALNTGTSEIQSASRFEIDTRTLRIQPADAHSIAKVQLDAGNQVLVTAINAPVDVRNQGGVLVARVFPSLPMNFLPQAAPAKGAAANTYNSDGCVLDTGDSVVISDPTGRQVFELRGKKGANFTGNVGKRVNVVGVIDSSATPKPGAVKAAKGGMVQVVTVAGLKADKDQSQSGCEGLAKTLGISAVAGSGAAVAAGAATSASVASAAAAAGAAGIAVPAAAAVSTAVVVGGVAAAGAAAAGIGVAASGSKSSPPPCVSPCTTS